MEEEIEEEEIDISLKHNDEYLSKFHNSTIIIRIKKWDYNAENPKNMLIKNEDFIK